MDRLTPLAAAFLEAEDADPAASLAIGSFAIFEGPAPAFDDFVDAIAGRLPLIPRYRQKLRSVPFDLAAPAWVDDPRFDLRWHVRNTALPAPGGPAEIGRLMSRVMTRRMDRTRPLWEYWFCEGLADGRWALLSKLHHSMVDGVSGTDLYRLVLDPSPEPGPAVPDDWQPAPPASTARLHRAGALAPARLAGRCRSGAGPVARRATSAGPAAPLESARGALALTGARTPGARHDADRSAVGQPPLRLDRRSSLDDVRTVRKAYGATVNDVALAAVTGGFRRLLLARGRDPGRPRAALAGPGLDPRGRVRSRSRTTGSR